MGSPKFICLALLLSLSLGLSYAHRVIKTNLKKAETTHALISGSVVHDEPTDQANAHSRPSTTGVDGGVSVKNFGGSDDCGFNSPCDSGFGIGGPCDDPFGQNGPCCGSFGGNGPCCNNQHVDPCVPPPNYGCLQFGTLMNEVMELKNLIKGKSSPLDKMARPMHGINGHSEGMEHGHHKLIMDAMAPESG